MVKRCGAPRDGRSAGYWTRTAMWIKAASTIMAIARCAVTDSPELPDSTVILPRYAWKPVKTTAAVAGSTMARRRW